MSSQNQINSGQNSAARLVISTFPSLECARQIGTLLVDSQLVACINLVPGVESIYRWKGEVTRDAEVLGIMKTSELALPRLEEVLAGEHPYEVPEFVVICPETGSEAYLDWIEKNVKNQKNN